MKKIIFLTFSFALIIGMAFTACKDDSGLNRDEVITNYCIKLVECTDLNQTECEEMMITDVYDPYPQCGDQLDVWYNCMANLINEECSNSEEICIDEATAAADCGVSI